MKAFLRELNKLTTRIFMTLLLLVSATVSAEGDNCDAVGELGFVCGMQNAEDLVQVPDTHWIIASGMAPGASIYLIDSRLKSWSVLYPGEIPRIQQDMEMFGACPGAPDPASLVSHSMCRFFIHQLFVLITLLLRRVLI